MDLGTKLQVEACTDAKAALGIIQRVGVGKVRHIRTQALWLQAIGREHRVQFHKFLGGVNPADAFTKYLTEAKMNDHLLRLNAHFEE